MEHELIERINELARKKRAEGLTEAEAAEQQALRAQYLREFRDNMEQILSNVSIQEKDGSVTPLKKKNLQQ